MTDKMIRTPREWDETCRQCRGTGAVHKREHFWLLTPDEQEKLFGKERVVKLDPKHDVPHDVVVCWVSNGASIFEACKEGVTLARAYGRPVAFEFNGVAAVCEAGSDPEEVAKAWWPKVYGQTYEQSVASR